MTTQALTLTVPRHGRPPDPPKLATDATRSRGLQRSWKKTERCRRRCVKDADGKKTNHQESACSHRLISDRFGSALTEGEYIDLVDYTGRHVYPGKRGVIKESEPKAPDKLGLNAEHCVQEFGEGFCAKWFRVIGELEDMIEKAIEIKQRTLFGIGLARRLAKG